MSNAHPVLGIELRFWPNDQPGAWHDVLAALWSWDPELRPQAFHVTSGQGWEIADDRPWEEARSVELVGLCAGRTEFSWFMGNDARHYFQCSGRDGRISLAIQIPAPQTSIADRYLDLIARMPASNRPELGLLFDYADADVAFEREGLRRLRFIPPILHLGPRAVEQRGGIPKLRHAPCDVRDAAGHGLLLIVRADPFSRSTKQDEARAAAVAAFLEISDTTPLVLIPPESAT